METSARRLGEEQSGYILATTAILLVPLMVFAAFAVDVGGWYVEADQAQRAADAAALGGVVWMPDGEKASDVAEEIAAANGFVDQPGCDFPLAGDCTATTFPQVVTYEVGTQGLRVEIITGGEGHFGKVVGVDEIRIERFAAAKYVLPVPMGNPTSTLGGGTETVAGAQSNFYMRAASECGPRAQGDFIGAGGGCSGGAYDPANPNTGNNPNHRNEGHTFIIDIPDNSAWELQARLTCAEFGGTQAQAPMRFTLYPADNTNLDNNDNLNLAPFPPVTVNRPGAATCATDGSDWSWDQPDPAPWVTIRSNLSTIGHYVLHSKNVGWTADQKSLYSLRVVPTGTGQGNWACSRLDASGAACPNVYAEDFLTTYTNSAMFDPLIPLSQSLLYLAEIDEVHRNKTMEIILFDPADGIDSMQVLNPQGQPMELAWWAVDCSDYGYSNPGEYSCAGDTQVENGGKNLGTEAAPIQEFNAFGEPHIDGGGWFQDVTIKIRLDLPNDYECVDPGGGLPENCWWTVRYSSTGTASETTTWKVSVIGDPVRLTE